MAFNSIKTAAQHKDKITAFRIALFTSIIPLGIGLNAIDNTLMFIFFLLIPVLVFTGTYSLFCN